MATGPASQEAEKSPRKRRSSRPEMPRFYVARESVRGEIAKLYRGLPSRPGRRKVQLNQRREKQPHRRNEAHSRARCGHGWLPRGLARKRSMSGCVPELSRKLTQSGSPLVEAGGSACAQLGHSSLLPALRKPPLLVSLPIVNGSLRCGQLGRFHGEREWRGAARIPSSRQSG